MAARDPSDRSTIASIGGHESWAKTPDRTARTALARQAFRDRFEREVDPGGTLQPAERARSAEHARKAFYLRLALKSARARRARKAASSPTGLSAQDGDGV